MESKSEETYELLSHSAPLGQSWPADEAINLSPPNDPSRRQSEREEFNNNTGSRQVFGVGRGNEISACGPSTSISEPVGAYSRDESKLCRPESPTEPIGGTEIADSPVLVKWEGLPWYRILGDVAGIMLSILFIILGVCIVSLHGKEESAWSILVVQATELAPSFWPVIFSSIIGNTLKAYASWRLERGIPLIYLEQLLASLTMGNTVTSSYTLSLFNMCTVFLLLIWAFNPLGSQSSLRSIQLHDRSVIQEGSVAHLNQSVPRWAGEFDVIMSSWMVREPAVKIAYSSMLATATSATQYCNGTCSDFDELVHRLVGRESVAAQVAMDLQGNPRIPSLKHTPGYDASNPEKWLTVRWNESVQEYSSLVGRRYSGLSSDFRGNVTFTMNTSYTEVFGCSQWVCQGTKYNNNEAMQKWFEINYIRFNNKYNKTLNARPYNNASSDFFLSELYKRYYCRRDLGIEDLSFAMDATSTFVTKDRGYPISTYPNSTVFIGKLGECNTGCGQCMTSCSVRTIHVNSRVVCRSTGITTTPQCRVHQIRQMPISPFPSSSTIFNWDSQVLKKLVTRFPLMGKEVGDRYSSFTERFIQDPASMSHYGATIAAWCTIPMRLFEARFNLLLNTYVDSAWDSSGILGSSSLVTGLNATSMLTVPLPPVYKLNKFWIIVYFVSTILLLSAAITSLLIRLASIGPQLLGYVGSLVRDSPYFSHVRPLGNTTESGEETSKRLASLQVGVLDLSPEDDVGKIAFVPSTKGSRLRKNRFYV